MSRIFYLEKNEYTIISLNELRLKWRFLPNNAVKEIICIEEQYLLFFVYLYSNLRHANNTDCVGFEIFSNIRAIAIKQAMMIVCSIIEAALLCHADVNNN